MNFYTVINRGFYFIFISIETTEHMFFSNFHEKSSDLQFLQLTFFIY